MNHFDDEIILKFVLEILDEEKAVIIENHLVECETCSAKLNDAKKQLQIIGSYNPRIEKFDYPLPKRNDTLYIWVKRAAILIIGFLAGYTTSVLSQPDQITVVAQQLITKTPAVPVSQLISCQKVDIW